MKKFILLCLLVVGLSSSQAKNYDPSYGVTVERQLDAINIDGHAYFNVTVRLKSKKKAKSGVKVIVTATAGEKKKVFKKVFADSFLYLINDEHGTVVVAEGNTRTLASIWRIDLEGEDFWQGWIKENGLIK